MHEQLFIPNLKGIELAKMPRPPKDLRVFELWGVDEDLLHHPERLSTTSARVLERLNLNPVGEQQIQAYYDDVTGAIGYSYNQFLKQSLYAGHTYFEEGGHFDGMVAICDPNAELDPLAKVLYEEFKPKSGGWVYERPYPNLEHLKRLAQDLQPFQPITTTQAYRSWPIPPFGSDPKSE